MKPRTAKNLSPTEHADRYRAYSRAMRVLSKLAYTEGADLKAQSRIMNYLYEEGHKHWVALCALPLSDFAHGFDSSRAMDARP